MALTAEGENSEHEIEGFAKIGVTFTCHDLLGKTLSLQNVIDLVSPLNRERAIARCAEWDRRNVLVLTKYGNWSSSAAESDRQWLWGLFPARFQLRAFCISNDENFVSPFTDVGLTGLISLLCWYATDGPAEPVTPSQEQWALLQALFAIQEGIFPNDFLKMSLEEQFPYEYRQTLANLSVQNRLAYDLGRIHALLTVPACAAKLNGMSVCDWFRKRIGISAEDYQVVANVIFGSAFRFANYAELQADMPILFSKMKPLLDLCSWTTHEAVIGVAPADLQGPPSPPKDLSDLLRLSNCFSVRPMLCFEDRYICTSAHAMFNKVHRSLPYLCIQGGANVSEIKEIRGEFGNIFEMYVIWLMEEWLPKDEFKFITNYWVKPEKPDSSAERDILIISGETAYLFEIKSTVPGLSLRNFGDLSEIVALYKAGAKQAFTAAESLIRGTAYLDKNLEQGPPKVTRVFPCAITFEFLGIRMPHSRAFERELSKATKKPLFDGVDGIEPFQIFDIQQVELWSDLFNLPGEASRLLKTLERRSLNEIDRYKEMPELHSFRNDFQKNPGKIFRLASLAEKASQKRLREIEPVA